MSTKKSVLALLENRRGENVSGEYIAKHISVTRNAVWKAVNELKKDGYKIKAVTNKGYCLCDDNDILSVQGMLPFLSDKEISDRIFIHASLESTNKTAKELAVSGCEHGTVVMADHQTAGKGRYGRGFFSPPGHGIYMSFILHPQLWHRDITPTLVTSYAAVSVCEAIETTTGKAPQIKWVNDVFLDGKKICGILTEAVTDFESGNTQWIVVGIGINFITPKTGFPEEIRSVAGSLFSEEKPTITRNELAAIVANRMFDIGNRLGNKAMIAEYRKRLMMLGKTVIVSGGNEAFEAVAVDIDDVGRLIVKRDDGEIVMLSSGEVSVRA